MRKKNNISISLTLTDENGISATGKITNEDINLLVNLHGINPLNEMYLTLINEITKQDKKN